MQLRQSIRNTKTFFQRSLRSLKRCFFSPGYHKLSKSSSFRPFSCGSCRDGECGIPQTDGSFTEFSHEWQSSLQCSQDIDCPTKVSIEKRKEEECGSDPSGGSTVIVKVSKEISLKQEEDLPAEKVQKKMVSSHSYHQAVKRGGDDGFALAQKMKELEMMDVGDMDHVLDVEEALHYYSRLTSPVYVGIVDRFFMDMYTDFSDPPKGSVRRPIETQGRGRPSRRGRRW